MNYQSGYSYEITFKDGSTEKVSNELYYEGIVKLNYVEIINHIKENIDSYLKVKKYKFYDVIDVNIKIRNNK